MSSADAGAHAGRASNDRSVTRIVRRMIRGSFEESGGAQPFLGDLAAGFLHRFTILLFGAEGRDLGIVLLLAGPDVAGRGLDDQQLALAAEQRDLALPARIDTARRRGEVDVGRELAVVLDEQCLVRGDELLDEG